MSEPGADDVPTVDELLTLVQRLDADNERLRMKALELGRLVEDAVTAQVTAERRVDELGGRIALLETELQALADTRMLRVARPFRSAYGRLRTWWVGHRG